MWNIGGCELMSNVLAIPDANKAIRQIEQVEKTLNVLSKILDSSELDLLCEVSNNLNTAKLRINKIRGFF